MKTNINGFTLIEILIAVAIIGILASIAYPSYQQYIIKTNRTDMMSEMHNIAAQIQSRKLAQGKYSNAIVSGLGGSYPKNSNVLYMVTFTPDPLTSQWVIRAEPKSGTRMVGDGTLTLDYQGKKCRDSLCGADSGWK